MLFNWRSAISFNQSILSVSVPNTRVSIPNFSSNLTAPSENISDDWVAKTNGNSITISIPLSRQILVLSHLFSIDISPLCVNEEDTTAIMILFGYNCFI